MTPERIKELREVSHYSGSYVLECLDEIEWLRAALDRIESLDCSDCCGADTIAFDALEFRKGGGK